MHITLYLKCVTALMAIYSLSSCTLPQTYNVDHRPNAWSSLTPYHRMRLPQVESYRQQAGNNIFMQREDFSCGAASLATLMSYYFEDYNSERDVLDTVESLLSVEQFSVVEEKGLSMLELETIAKHYGYESASVQLTLESLEELKSPIIVFLEKAGSPHFAVLKAVFAGDVYLADPSLGNIKISLKAFSEIWSGKAFFMGKSTFEPKLSHALSIDKGMSAYMARTVVESEMYRVAPKTFSIQPSLRPLR